MTFKTIFAPLAFEETAKLVSETALLLAGAFKGHVMAQHVRPRFTGYPPMEFYPASASATVMAMEGHDEAAGRYARALRAKFEDLCAASDAHVVPVPEALKQNGVTASWTEEVGQFPLNYGLSARAADLVVMAIPDAKGAHPERELFEAVLMQSGAPVFLTPRSGLSAVPRRERPRAIMRLHAGFHNADSPFPVARVVDWISVPLGVATLRDQFNDVQDDAARYALMSWFFEENLADFAPYKDEQAREGFQIVGTSGTVTTVAASHLGLKRYDRTKVDGLRMTSDQIDKVINRYLELGPEGRRRDPRIGQDRQALIMSGAAILQALLRSWPTDRLSVADRGLREGLLYAQMSADGVLEDGPF